MRKGTGGWEDSINWLWVASSKQKKIQISNSISHWKLWQFTHVCSPNSGDVSIIPIELSVWFCFVWSFAVMFCYMLLCAVMWFKCENYAQLVRTPQPRKKHWWNAKNVPGANFATSNHRWSSGVLLGRTDRGCFCSEYVIRNRWIALDVKKPLNAVNKNLTKE